MANENRTNQLGKAVKAARKAKGLTQAQLATLLEITPRHLKAIENSGQKPSYGLFARVVRELNISSDGIIYSVTPVLQPKLQVVKGGGNIS